MNWLWLATWLVVLFVVCPILIGRFCGLTDRRPSRRLHRRPNVRLVRDEKDAAA